ncbi:oligoribonuclease [Auraticoccus monumenti]|uniref:Oligoribonuclease n=1 Tax=Auraticoccus monumenti TaxID=675864 RepID=A0A1G7EYN9_9ACTN|nr:oligoribonuclease [Auraticoccus monumenti]SDE68596.1 oligoribonuclease [Auraticoccus monumenti]
MSQNLVWIDCEMTGLDLEDDVLVEVAALVTDGELNVLGEGVDVVIKPPAAALEQMGDFVRRMHTSSGLLAELEHGVELAEAEQLVLDHIRQFVPEPRKAPLAGNTIGTDRAFLLRQMPTLEAHVHYRNVDVSSFKELARRWFPKVYYHSPEKGGNHRALADIQESIEEMRYYREALFVAPPGPDSRTCRQIASRHAGSLTGLVVAKDVPGTPTGAPAGATAENRAPGGGTS